MPLKDDFDLQTSHLQALSSRDEIAGLFTRHGYNTNARLTQTADAMGLTGESLKRDVRHIERIADHEDGALQVYLAELKSVTVAHTQALARAMRNRAGDFLWVLTSDYQRLDFVLMERSLPERQPDGGISTRGVVVRPRVLTVDRRNPGAVELRVLRRFSYTEADADYQIQKLKSAYTIAEWSEPFFNNRALFSDYYLNFRLKDTPEWGDASRMAPALRQLQGTMVDVRRRVSGQPEDVARRTLIEPALKALGFDLEPGKHSASNADEPDYFLHRDGTGKPVAYCTAYVWARNLDGRDDEGRDPKTADENPGALIVSLLDRDDAPDWAIVTNGKLWRLYSRQAHSRATNYYEIDLEETIASPDPGLAFRYFWLFFNAAAFVPDTNRAGKSFLSWLFDECNLYARELEERLKDRVFGEIFPHFAKGFIEHMGGSDALLALSEDKRAQRLSDVHHATLTFLYRLLFLLYAEARNLLPVKGTRDYYEISLTRLKEEIKDNAGTIDDEVEGKLKKAYRASADATGLYDRLLRLFKVIDRGDPDVNVPTYNGGLFVTFDSRHSEPRRGEESRPRDAETLRRSAAQSDTEAESPETRSALFLQQHKIPDRFLAAGMDRMARDIDLKRGDLVFIDYKSLGVRQLGSIYEGLLEFNLRVATEKMAVVRGKKADEIVPYSEAKKGKQTILRLGRGRAAAEWTLPKGEVYLENDKRERKATGSYYTPDYIVKYIVRHTVGPVLGEKFDAITPRIRQAEKRFRDSVKRKREVEKVEPDRPALLIDIAGDVLRDLFDVKVLDPAMGSGHFLVEAVDFITDRMVQFMNRFVFLSQFFAGTRGAILDAMEQQEVTIDRGRLTDVNLLKRHVLKRCIYGVDLNPMAVELAKVSLWLDCFTLGAPLSFLDHHLKCGNSLIGARIDEARDAVEFKDKEQISMFAGSQFTGILLATDLMRHVGELSDATAEQVAASRAEFHRASDALAPFKRIMDVYVSRWFGNDLTPGPSPERRGEQPLPPRRGKAGKGVEPTIEFLRRDETRAWLNDPAKGVKKLDAAMKQVAETAQQAADDKHFFHWELEFPEVFFGPAQGTTQAVGLKEGGGFDAVIGNPPYDEISEYAWGRETAESNYLADQRDYQTALGGRLNLFRFFILRATTLLRQNGSHGFIVPLPLLSDQFSVSVRKLLLSRYQFHEIHCFPQKDDPQNRVFEQAKLSTCVYVVFNTLPHLKFRIYGYPGRYFEAGTFYITTADEVIAVDPENQSIPVVDENAWHLLKKLATGDSYRRFGEAGEVFPGEVMLNAQFAKYILDETTGKLLLRGAHIGRYESNDNPKQGTPQYLDVDAFLAESGSDTKAQHNKYRRIGFQRGAAIDNWRRLIGTVLEPGCFLTDTVGYILPKQPYSIHFLLALFECRLFEWRFGLYSTTNHVNAYEVKSLPLRHIAFTTPEKRRAALVAQAKDLTTRQDQAGLLAFVDQRLASQPEESDVVHDMLAFLAEQMIDLNKRKQSEQKRFLGWLESALTPSPSPKSGRGERAPSPRRGEGKGEGGLLNSLSGKTTIRNYLGDYQKGEEPASFDDIEDVLFKNRNRLDVSLSDARLVAKLKAEYEKSLAVLLPIKDQLAWTDRLMDLIVYRLYGLTEEEIGVVEGRSM